MSVFFILCLWYGVSQAGPHTVWGRCTYSLCQIFCFHSFCSVSGLLPLFRSVTFCSSTESYKSWSFFVHKILEAMLSPTNFLLCSNYEEIKSFIVKYKTVWFHCSATWHTQKHSNVICCFAFVEPRQNESKVWRRQNKRNLWFKL